MNYPLLFDSSPTESTLIGNILASFSRVIACASLLEHPVAGHVTPNREAKSVATRECAEFIVSTFLFQRSLLSILSFSSTGLTSFSLRHFPSTLLILPWRCHF